MFQCFLAHAVHFTLAREDFWNNIVDFSQIYFYFSYSAGFVLNTDTKPSPLVSKWWEDTRNLFYNPWHWGSSVSFCPSLLAPSWVFETNPYITKNHIRFKYPHPKYFLPIQFCSIKRFKRCTVVPYRHPALHPCLPLHQPALLCLQALCPARPHMELEYIQILRKKKKIEKNTIQWKGSTLNCNNSL